MRKYRSPNPYTKRFHYFGPFQNKAAAARAKSKAMKEAAEFGITSRVVVHTVYAPTGSALARSKGKGWYVEVEEL